MKRKMGEADMRFARVDAAVFRVSQEAARQCEYGPATFLKMERSQHTAVNFLSLVRIFSKPLSCLHLQLTFAIIR